MKNRLIYLILFLLTTLSVFAKENTDSVSSHYAVPRSWFLVPAGFYQEETSLGLGINGGYYLKSKSLDKISSISGSAFYTLLNQVKINLNPRFSLEKTGMIYILFLKNCLILKSNPHDMRTRNFWKK